MLTDEQRFNIQDFFAKEVDGGVSKGYYQIFEDMVENDVISQEVFDANEMEICGIFDDGWFTCSVCEWTVPMDAIAHADLNEPTCSDCYCEEDEE